MIGRLGNGWRGIVLGACCLALLLGGVAAARIVPQKGIAKINLGMTRAEVIDRKGRPDSERVVRHEILGQQRRMRYGKTRVAFSGARARSEVIGVLTRNRKQRTRSGVGVGSTEQEVKDGVDGVRCRTKFGIRECVKGRFQPGKRVTVFKISKGERKVKRVTVAIVID